MFEEYNRLYKSIFIFLFLYLMVIILKPCIVFDKRNNCLRNFGVGYKNTSILPLWLCTIFIAIISYFLVYYIDYTRNILF